MKIQGSVALVTGANRGLGAAFTFMDTDMARGAPEPKASPDEIARMTIAALEASQSELLADDVTRSVHAGLTAVPPMYLVMLG